MSTQKEQSTPEEGWKHATNAAQCMLGGSHVFGWYEGGKLWSGIVVEVDVRALRVRLEVCQLYERALFAAESENERLAGCLEDQRQTTRYETDVASRSRPSGHEEHAEKGIGDRLFDLGHFSPKMAPRLLNQQERAADALRQLTALRAAGTPLANCAYNLSQMKNPGSDPEWPAWQATMERLFLAWDKAVRPFSY